MFTNTIINWDCIEVMKTMPDWSIDAIITDPPYWTTKCNWDEIIPFDVMWEQIERVVKPNWAVILFWSQPFTTKLINSNIENFKHEIIWFKNVPTGMAQAKYAPMKYHENILVFWYGKIWTFNKQMQEREWVWKDCYKYTHYCWDSNHVKMPKVEIMYDENLVNPSSVVLFNTVPNRKWKVHPTQKPVNLMEYLIKQYTNEWDTVLDFTAWSWTTWVACKNTNRNSILIENDEGYCDIIKQRLSE